MYRTDAPAGSGVGTIELPPGANIEAAYAGVVIKGSPVSGAAHDVLDWMIGPEAQRIFADLGFAARAG